MKVVTTAATSGSISRRAPATKMKSKSKYVTIASTALYMLLLLSSFLSEGAADAPPPGRLVGGGGGIRSGAANDKLSSPSSSFGNGEEEKSNKVEGGGGDGGVGVGVGGDSSGESLSRFSAAAYVASEAVVVDDDGGAGPSLSSSGSVEVEGDDYADTGGVLGTLSAADDDVDADGPIEKELPLHADPDGPSSSSRHLAKIQKKCKTKCKKVKAPKKPMKKKPAMKKPASKSKGKGGKGASKSKSKSKGKGGKSGSKSKSKGKGGKSGSKSKSKTSSMRGKMNMMMVPSAVEVPPPTLPDWGEKLVNGTNSTTVAPTTAGSGVRARKLQKKTKTCVKVCVAEEKCKKKCKVIKNKAPKKLCVTACKKKGTDPVQAIVANDDEFTVSSGGVISGNVLSGLGGDTHLSGGILIVDTTPVINVRFGTLVLNPGTCVPSLLFFIGLFKDYASLTLSLSLYISLSLFLFLLLNNIRPSICFCPS